MKRLGCKDGSVRIGHCGNEIFALEIDGKVQRQREFHIP